jgi:hypothetical protein
VSRYVAIIRTELSVSPLKSRTNSVFNGLGDLTFDKASGEGAESLVEEIVTAVTNAELECVHLDFDIFDAEEAAFGVAGIVHNRDSGGDSTSTEEHVSDAGVLEFLHKSMNI